MKSECPAQPEMLSAQEVAEVVSSPGQYVFQLGDQDSCLLAAHRKWLTQLLTKCEVPSAFITHETRSPHQVASFLADRTFPDYNWKIVYVKRLKIQDVDVYSNPILWEPNHEEANSTLAEALHFVNECNFKNDWKDTRKRLSWQRCQKVSSRMHARNSWTLECLTILSQLYPGVPVVFAGANKLAVPRPEGGRAGPTNSLVPLHAVLCTDRSLLLFYSFEKHNIHSLLTFSPALFSDNHLKQLFILFQVVKLFKYFYERSLAVGDVSLHSFSVDENLHVTFQPQFVNHSLPEAATASGAADPYHQVLSQEASRLLSEVEEAMNYEWAGSRGDCAVNSAALVKAVNLWLDGVLSNLDYLLFLNYLAGRRFGHPNYHPVIPWVTDFSDQAGGWRDLSRSKFRLNKGDEQLDRTYETGKSVGEPHHVTDVLSEITYYVYKARQTDRGVLTRTVRSSWVPAEYPVSVQRLMEWSPDEAIPELYTDPKIFISQHEDLSDLELPPWTKSPEEFVDWHLSMLESPQVSSNLSTWIDLTFGYKLSGSAAVRAKNVCLALVDKHEDLRLSGVVQLFSQPHPARRTKSLSFTPPVFRLEPDYESSDSDGDEDEVASRQLSKSRTSLSSLQEENKKEENAKINFTPEVNPLAALYELESVHNFVTKVTGLPVSEEEAAQPKPHGSVSIVQRQKVRDMQVLGCLFLEIFLPKRFLCLGEHAGLKVRYQTAVSIVQNESKTVPSCIREIVKSLLFPNTEVLSKTFLIDSSDKYCTISPTGLPLPSADQLLTPLLTSLHFPPVFTSIHTALVVLHSTRTTLESLQLVSDATSAAGKVAEFQVKQISRILVPRFPQMSLQEFELVLPLLRHLTMNPSTAVLSSWIMFDSAASVLGPKETERHFLKALLALYHTASPTSKHLKLYHRSFLVSLSVRLSQKTFLNNFINYLIEAVGGYKDVEWCSARSGLTENWSTEQDSEVSGDRKPSSPMKTPREPVGFEEGEVFAFDGADNEVPPLLTKFNMSSEMLEEMEEAFKQARKSPVETKENDVFYVPSSFDPSKESKAPFETTLVTQPEVLSKKNNGNISAVAGESVMWLAHRLGPMLASKYLAKNLLRMLNLCYLGPEGFKNTGKPLSDQQIRISPGSIEGDINAAPVLDCLAHLAGLFGDQMILVQYLPFSWELIHLCKKKVSPNLEGGLLGCLAMVHTVIPLLSDSVLMNELQDNLTANVLIPVLQIATTRRLVFAGGSRPRSLLLYRLLDIIYLIGLRIGEEMSRNHLTPIVAAFFSAFDKAHVCGVGTEVAPENETAEFSRTKPTTSSEPASVEWTAANELKGVLTCEIAYAAFVAFYHLLGGGHLEAHLTNLDLVKGLCREHQSSLQQPAHRPIAFSELQSAPLPAQEGNSGFSDTSTGNKIVVSSTEASSESQSTSGVSRLISRPCRDSGRHLRGNWLAYWEHEIGRPDTDSHFNLKQIRLQSWSGHSGSVRSLAVLDNENSFLSGGKDKTVRLWSIRNMGDGTSVGSAQSVYTGHKKAVFSVAFQERFSHVASCDGAIHVWDPFVGNLVQEFDAGRGASFCVMKAAPAPTPLLVAATTEGHVRFIDTRVASGSTELKVSFGAAGLIRSLSISDEGNLLAVGHSSGYISLLDLRTGRLRTGFKAHDGEVLTLTNIDENHFVSTSLDQTASGWKWEDGRLAANLPAPLEPLHCVCACEGQVITGSTANKVSVHNGVWADAVVSVNKLKSDFLKGNLMQMATVTLNRMLLMATDSGSIHLVC